MWQQNKRDEGFAHSLNATAYLSSGLAGMGKLTKKLEVENAEMKNTITQLASVVMKLKARVDQLGGVDEDKKAP